MSEFRAVASSRDLDGVWTASHVEPVILFKHSQTCGVSHMARALLAEGPGPAPVYEIVVPAQRALATAVAETLGVRHESPQVIVVARGKAVWHSSHAGVRLERIAQAWREATASFTPAPAR